MSDSARADLESTCDQLTHRVSELQLKSKDPFTNRLSDEIMNTVLMDPRHKPILDAVAALTTTANLQVSMQNDIKSLLAKPWFDWKCVEVQRVRTYLTHRRINTLTHEQREECKRRLKVYDAHAWNPRNAHEWAEDMRRGWNETRLRTLLGDAKSPFTASGTIPMVDVAIDEMFELLIIDGYVTSFDSVAKRIVVLDRWYETMSSQDETQCAEWLRDAREELTRWYEVWYNTLFNNIWVLRDDHNSETAQ